MFGPMFLWITRSAPYNLLTAHRARTIGHTVLNVPVLEVRPTLALAPAADPDVIVFTSAHGVDLHPFNARLVDVPVFAVGDLTAEATRRRGYRQVHSAQGDLSDLQKLIVTSVPRPAHVVHFSALEPSGDLPGYLNMSGFQAERCVVYDTCPAENGELARAVDSLSALDGIVIHSRKAARLVAEVIFTARWNGIVFCISEACAAELRHVPGILLEVAARPTEHSLMNLLRLFGGQKPVMTASQSPFPSLASTPFLLGQRSRPPLFFENDNCPTSEPRARAPYIESSDDPNDPPPSAA